MPWLVALMVLLVAFLEQQAKPLEMVARKSQVKPVVKC